MFFVDTHTHLYLNAFDEDRAETIERALEQGIKAMLLPNIDSTSIDGMIALCEQFPENCFPMMGLHPTSVKENYKEELVIVENWLGKHMFYAIGETGIDLYWDKTRLEEQKISLTRQIELAKKGIITREMKAVARAENIDVEYVQKGLAGGTIVIPKNSFCRKKAGFKIKGSCDNNI